MVSTIEPRQLRPQMPYCNKTKQLSSVGLLRDFFRDTMSDYFALIDEDWSLTDDAVFHDKCPMPCSIQYYEVSSSEQPTSLVGGGSLTIHLAADGHLSYRNRERFTLSQIFSDIGGILSLIYGISVYRICSSASSFFVKKQGSCQTAKMMGIGILGAILLSQLIVKWDRLSSGDTVTRYYYRDGMTARPPKLTLCFFDATSLSAAVQSFEVSGMELTLGNEGGDIFSTKTSLRVENGLVFGTWSLVWVPNDIVIERKTTASNTALPCFEFSPQNHTGMMPGLGEGYHLRFTPRTSVAVHVGDFDIFAPNAAMTEATNSNFRTHVTLAVEEFHSAAPALGSCQEQLDFEQLAHCMRSCTLERAISAGRMTCKLLGSQWRSSGPSLANVRQCETSREAWEQLSVFRSYRSQCSLACPIKCVKMKVSYHQFVRYALTEEATDYADLYIYFKFRSVERYEQVPEYSYMQMFGEVGATLGMLFGVSFSDGRLLFSRLFLPQWRQQRAKVGAA